MMPSRCWGGGGMGLLAAGVLGLHECDKPVCVKVAADGDVEHVVAGSQGDNMERMARMRRRPHLRQRSDQGVPRLRTRSRSLVPIATSPAWYGTVHAHASPRTRAPAPQLGHRARTVRCSLRPAEQCCSLRRGRCACSIGHRTLSPTPGSGMPSPRSSRATGCKTARRSRRTKSATSRTSASCVGTIIRSAVIAVIGEIRRRKLEEAEQHS